MINFAWAKTPADHMDQYADIVGSSQGKGVPAGMMSQMKRHASYIKTKLTPEEHAKLHKNISAHANRLMKDDEISAEEAAYIKKTYSPPVKESKDMDIQEKKMTEPEMKKREEIVKSMKKSYGDFKKRYGERAKEVMYATANKQAMKSEETEGQHYCAKHVYSQVYGEGVVVEGQHAEPDDNGNIEWYTVQFDHGEEVIFTEDVEVMMAEYHNNHSPAKKKKKKGE
jgi:hypothetical protein